MISKDAIEHAIGAHALWRDRLQATLAAGLPLAAMDSVRRVDRCEFGIWLLGPALGPEMKASARFRTVDRLHAEFHAAASVLLDLARSGRTPEADLAMAPGGSFHEASAQLLAAMKAWHDSLG